MRTQLARLAAAVLLCAAAAIAAPAAQNAIAQLGYDEPEARNMFLSAVNSGTVYFTPRTRTCSSPGGCGRSWT